MTSDSVSAASAPASGFGESSQFTSRSFSPSTQSAPRIKPKPGSPLPGAGRYFAAEWIALMAGLAIVGAMIGYALVPMHRSVDADERDRLRVQARVIDDNIGQQLDGLNRALVSVRDDFLDMPSAASRATPSMRLKALSDAIPSVRSMILLDAEGVAVASSSQTLLGHDFSDRDYFRVPRQDHNPATLYVAAPYRNSLGNFTVVFGRAIIAANGNFAGVAIAALEPEYFEVLMRSVLYAPDMWVSLGHGDGKVFVTMPHDAARTEADWQQAATTLPPSATGAPATSIVLGVIGGAGERRMTAMRQLSPPELHMDKPLVIAASRAEADVFAAWRQQALEYSIFFTLLCAGSVVGLYRGQWRRKAFAQLEASAERERLRHAEQLELALQGSDLGLWDWDLRDDRFDHDETARRQLGYAVGELGESGTDWRAYMHPADTPRLIEAIEAHFRSETPAYECEFRVRHKQGHWVWLLSRGKVVERDDFGVPVRMAGTHMDLTQRRLAESASERAAEMLRRTGELAHVGGWELEPATMRIEWSEQVYRLHELEPGSMPTLDEALDFCATDAQPLLRDAIEKGATEGTPWDLELPFVTAKGNPRWLRTQGMAVMEEGRPVRLLGAFQDITEKKTIALEMHRLNEQLTRLSTTDALTEVGNRRLFDQTLTAEWARAARRSEPVGLLMIDIDHFKAFNDHYGHPAGDVCLRQVARMVGEAVRRGGELVSRYGGEEFALLLPGADLAEAKRAAERCLQIVADAKIEHCASPISAWLTVSIGVASQIASAEIDCSGLVDSADAALYRAKRCGRARIEC